MHRCFTDPSSWSDADIVLAESEAHHLCKVMRARPGDEVIVFDGAGRSAPARLRSVSPAVLEITGEVGLQVRRNRFTLIQAIPKGHRMDFIMEKGTELGMAEVCPVITVNTVTRPAGAQADNKLDRWRRIALSAARQCGTPWLPDISSIGGYEGAVRDCAGFDLLLVGSLTDEARPLRTVLEEHSDLRERGCSIGVIIGPEGDLTPAETALAVDCGAVPVSFGDLVLRVETASIYVLSALSCLMMH